MAHERYSVKTTNRMKLMMSDQRTNKRSEAIELLAAEFKKAAEAQSDMAAGWVFDHELGDTIASFTIEFPV